jgi:hypothetical protein
MQSSGDAAGIRLNLEAVDLTQNKGGKFTSKSIPEYFAADFPAHLATFPIDFAHTFAIFAARLCGTVGVENFAAHFTPLACDFARAFPEFLPSFPA